MSRWSAQCGAGTPTRLGTGMAAHWRVLRVVARVRASGTYRVCVCVQWRGGRCYGVALRDRSWASGLVAVARWALGVNGAVGGRSGRDACVRVSAFGQDVSWPAAWWRTTVKDGRRRGRGDSARARCVYVLRRERSGVTTSSERYVASATCVGRCGHAGGMVSGGGACTLRCGCGAQRPTSGRRVAARRNNCIRTPRDDDGVVLVF